MYFENIRSFKYFYWALVCLFLHVKHEMLSVVIFLGFCSRKFVATDHISRAWKSTQFSTALTQHVYHGCSSTDIVSSDFSDAKSFHQYCCSIMYVTACSYRLQQSVPNIPVSFCYIRLIQHWQTNRLFNQQTEQSVGVNMLISYLYPACRCSRPCNRCVAFLRV